MKDTFILVDQNGNRISNCPDQKQEMTSGEAQDLNEIRMSHGMAGRWRKVIEKTQPVKDPGAGWYTDFQVRDLLVAVQVYANSAGKQGLKAVTGETYGERAEHILQSFLQSKDTRETVGKFEGPLLKEVDDIFLASGDLLLKD